MKLVLLLVGCFCFFCPNTKASNNDCQLRAIALLKETSEIFVFHNHPYWHTSIDCRSETLGMEVVIHEAVHFEDVGAPYRATEKELEKWGEDEWKKHRRYPQFSLFTIDGKKHGEMRTTNAPSPHELINIFLKNHYPKLQLADSTNGIIGSLLNYINDQESLSYYSFTQGLVTELNAYAHGLRIEHRIKGDHPLILNGRYGLLGFIFFFKAYLYQLKESFPLVWNELFTSQDVVQIQTLFAQSAKVLRDTKHCKNMDEYEKKDVFSLISDEKFLGPLNEVLRNSDSLKTILCQ